MGICVTKAPAERYEDYCHVNTKEHDVSRNLGMANNSLTPNASFVGTNTQNGLELSNISTNPTCSTLNTSNDHSMSNTALEKCQSTPNTNIAIFGLQCGIQLFTPNVDESQLQQFNLSNLHNLSFDIEEPKFIEAMNYFCDAFSSLDSSFSLLINKKDQYEKINMDNISKAYYSAMESKGKINENANNLLGVYSIVIFCGFYLHSNCGNNLFEGLTHIKNVLNEMNQQPLLTKRLKTILESVLYCTDNKYYFRSANAPVHYWSKTEEQYVKNIVLFGVMIRNFIQNVIIFSENNEIKEEDECLSVEYNKLLDYKAWTPNLFVGAYFGGDKCTFQICVDFFKRIYPMIFNQNLQQEIGFINQYNEELIAYLKQLNDVQILNQLDKLDKVNLHINEPNDEISSSLISSIILSSKNNGVIKEDFINVDKDHFYYHTIFLKNLLTEWWLLNVYD